MPGIWNKSLISDNSDTELKRHPHLSHFKAPSLPEPRPGLCRHNNPPEVISLKVTAVAGHRFAACDVQTVSSSSELWAGNKLGVANMSRQPPQFPKMSWPGWGEPLRWDLALVLGYPKTCADAYTKHGIAASGAAWVTVLLHLHPCKYHYQEHITQYFLQTHSV